MGRSMDRICHQSVAALASKETDIVPAPGQLQTSEPPSVCCLVHKRYFTIESACSCCVVPGQVCFSCCHWMRSYVSASSSRQSSAPNVVNYYVSANRKRCSQCLLIKSRCCHCTSSSTMMEAAQHRRLCYSYIFKLPYAVQSLA